MSGMFRSASASASISLPVEAKNIRANVYTGRLSARVAATPKPKSPATASKSDTTGSLALSRRSDRRVAFDKGAVNEPTAADKLALFFRSNWPLGIPANRRCNHVLALVDHRARSAPSSHRRAVRTARSIDAERSGHAG